MQQQMNFLDLLYGKTSSERSPQTREKISAPSSKNSAKSKTETPLFLDLRGGATLFDGEMRGSSWQTDIPSRGASSMRNFGESPSVVEESSLSQILEDEVQEKYYLSETACKGVLRRAVNRGRIEKMPLVMKLGLILQGNVTMQEAMETGIFAGQLREITSEE